MADQFSARDVSFWAVFALAAWGLALISGALGSFVPQDIFSGLHASRMAGADLTQLRGQVTDLSAQTADLREQNSVLRQRLALVEDGARSVTKRVGALELSVPKLLEAGQETQPIDTTDITAATGGQATTMPADGGSVSYTTVPMTGAYGSATQQQGQPMPQALTQATPEAGQFGVALGPPIDASAGAAAWKDLNSRVGTLLLGLAPVLGHVEGSTGRRLVAGPFATEADARTVCGQMAKVGIACAGVPFVGDPLN